MKFLVVLLAVASLAHGKVLSVPDNHSAYGYLKNSIAEAERIRSLEEKIQAESRIVGGVPAGSGQYPYQVTTKLIYYSKRSDKLNTFSLFVELEDRQRKINWPTDCRENYNYL